MKKTFKTILAVMLAVLTMSGCATSENTGNNYNSTSQWSEEQVVEEAIKLEKECISAIQTGDFNRYAACFESGNDETLHNTFNSSSIDFDLNQYSTIDGLVFDRVDGYYFVNIVFYNVSGSHPNTSMNSFALVDAFKVVDDTLKIVTSEEAINKLNNHLLSSDVYPDYVMESLNAGRNATMFNGSNFMYTSSDMVYNGHAQSELKFASQNEDGSVELVVWIANGSNQNLHYTNGVVSMTDDQIGTILNASINIDKTIPAHSSTTLHFSIPAGEVYTGMAPWSSIHSSVDTYF